MPRFSFNHAQHPRSFSKREEALSSNVGRSSFAKCKRRLLVAWAKSFVALSIRSQIRFAQREFEHERIQQAGLRTSRQVEMRAWVRPARYGCDRMAPSRRQPRTPCRVSGACG